MRAIEDVTLDLSGLTVLVGDNGTGKSTILEALEILHLAAMPVDFVSDVIEKRHGGLRGLMRRGANELRLGVTVEGDGPAATYDFSVGLVGNHARILEECAFVRSEEEALVPILQRREESVTVVPDHNGRPSRANELRATGNQLVMSFLGMAETPSIVQIAKALAWTEVHVPFETRPIWQQRELDIRVGPRWPSTIERSESLARYALNLPNAFQQLRNMGEDVWSRVIERARLGLGDDVRSFVMSPAGRGNIELEVVYGSAPDDPLPAEYLSEGQLSYLGFLALAELHEKRPVLAFDEPEVHLHPSLLARVVWLLEEASEHAPVILATHSDRLLDALADPVASVVLCDLDEDRSVRLRRPNADKLAEWLEDYRGFGSLRAEGYDAHVFDEPAAKKKE